MADNQVAYTTRTGKEIIPPPLSSFPRKDMAGTVFGRAVVIKFVGRRKRVCADSCWLCKCNCGKEFIAEGNHIKAGHVKSCGCLSRDTKSNLIHGQSANRIHGVWTKMKQRCYNTSDPKYPMYGARGIKVCERWRGSFVAFFEDMGTPPKGKTLDRIDNFGDYCPENCRWATPKQQARNTRNNVYYEFNGERLCLAAWAEKIGISSITLFYRFKHGWSVERALTTPLQVQRKKALV